MRRALRTLLVMTVLALFIIFLPVIWEYRWHIIGYGGLWLAVVSAILLFNHGAALCRGSDRKPKL